MFNAKNEETSIIATNMKPAQHRNLSKTWKLPKMTKLTFYNVAVRVVIQFLMQNMGNRWPSLLMYHSLDQMEWKPYAQSWVVHFITKGILLLEWRIISAILWTIFVMLWNMFKGTVCSLKILGQLWSYLNEIPMPSVTLTAEHKSKGFICLPLILWKKIFDLWHILLPNFSIIALEINMAENMSVLCKSSRECNKTILLILAISNKKLWHNEFFSLTVRKMLLYALQIKKKIMIQISPKFESCCTLISELSNPERIIPIHILDPKIPWAKLCVVMKN